MADLFKWELNTSPIYFILKTACTNNWILTQNLKVKSDKPTKIGSQTGS